MVGCVGMYSLGVLRHHGIGLLAYISKKVVVNQLYNSCKKKKKSFFIKVYL